MSPDARPSRLRRASRGAARLALGWAAALTAVTAVAVTRRARMRPTTPTPDADPVLIVRPCAGYEPHLARTLSSTARAHVTRPLIVRATVARADDPALPIAEAACAELRAQGLDAQALVVDARGPNLKAAQLAAFFATLDDPPALAVNVDSDVDLTDFDLDALLAPLDADPRLGASWAPPCEPRDAARTDADRASGALLGASLHAFALLCALDPGGLVGKVFAFRVEAVEAVGGFGALIEHLGEDMALASHLRCAGWGVAPAPLVAASRAGGRDAAAVLERYTRWMLVIRAQRPRLLPAYPLFFFPTAPLLALAALGLPAAPRAALAAAALGLGARLTTALAAQRFSRRPAPDARALLADVARADALLARAFARACSSTAFTWRGRPLEIIPGGRLRQRAASPS